jgi:aspartyl-tRNA(Asn)/glutamyl-tRNA(Gln) amidotransferase subunit C
VSVDRAEVERIAALARLRLDDDEAEQLTGELNRILDHVEALRALEEVAPTVAALPREAASTRASEEGAPDALERRPDEFAPRWAEGFFVVPPPPGVQHGEGGG